MFNWIAEKIFDWRVERRIRRPWEWTTIEGTNTMNGKEGIAFIIRQGEGWLFHPFDNSYFVMVIGRNLADGFEMRKRSI